MDHQQRVFAYSLIGLTDLHMILSKSRARSFPKWVVAGAIIYLILKKNAKPNAVSIFSSILSIIKESNSIS